MTWKPPPVFGAGESTTHDNNHECCCSAGDSSAAMQVSAWNDPASTAIMMGIGSGVGARSPSRTNSSQRMARRESQQSLGWKPPPSFAIIQENLEEEQRDCENGHAIEETTSYNMGRMHSTGKNSDAEVVCETNILISRQNATGVVGINERFVSPAHDAAKKPMRSVTAEDFRPFRKEIARYVAIKGTKPEDDNDVLWNELSLNNKGQNCANDADAGEAENLSRELIAAMADGKADLDRDFRSINEMPPMAISEGEWFAFWEGVRLTACASRRLAAVLQRRSCQQSLPRDAHPPPKRFLSIRAMSIARARKQCDAIISSNDHGASLCEEEEMNSLRPQAENSNGHPRSCHSLRAMSIARITREQCVPTSDVNAKASTDNNVVGNAGDAKDIKKLLEELEQAEKYQRRLEQQLRKAGVVIAEDIPYSLAKQKVAEISKRMVELHDGSQIEGNGVDTEAEYFKLEQEMEKYVTALELTEEWIEEQAEEERKWEDEMKEENEIALKMVLRHMPVDVRNRSESQLQQLPTPNKKFLARSIAQKFKRTNCLQLLRTNPEEMVKWHPSMFENLRVTGLTLTERRALHHHLKIIGDCWKKQCTGSGDKMTERKIVWFETLKSNFRESLRAYVRHVDAYGPPENHCCSMIGRQCPLKADKAIDYSGDYGYSEDSKYFKQTNGSLNSSDKGVTKCTKLDDKTHDQIGESSSSISAERALSNGRRTSMMIRYNVAMGILEEGDCCVKFKAEVQVEVEVEEDFSTKSKDGAYVDEAVAVAEEDIPVKYMGEVNVEEAVTEKDCFTKSKVVIGGDHW
eukprot:CAMPEP_0172398546 /NCGR_PEP_ID=MMETSP1061-20121228/36790_1 /TAXON_ID=37318 /ORGANISM="Pseudo-nitzschia pungens, Strain cf. pungens" /LENGTH=804 /DNA_ID=CAMNT_0013131095 /DNA_START=271 /DNA_END=2683 /DNA_ORIENTATION=-